MIILLMGVSGSGKTTIGKHLAATLNWEFYDGDDFHPAANISKMSRGMPLEDRDREPWLQALRQAIALWLQEGKNVILACSALKSSYRHQLTQESSQVHLVYLRGTAELIATRLAARQGHFMKLELLHSQFQALEEPQGAVVVDVAQPLAAIVEEIRAGLQI